jgi:molybdopterin molybdotransferase
VARDLLSVDEARAIVLDRVEALPGETVALEHALGRVTAEDVRSADDVPGFDNSAMDGFALRAADTASASIDGPARLALVDESRAGHPASRPVGEGEAIRISTGAMLPEGADAVLRQEDAGEEAGAITVSDGLEEGRDIRRRGEDVRAGAVVVPAGTVLGPAELGVLASVGVADLTCSRRPRLALLVTGDELVEPGRELAPGQIRNSNAYSVAAQARRAGGEVASVETVGDDYAATVRAIGSGLGSDVLVVCGGVSVGPHDHVKPALAELGVEEALWGIALRPGRPTWFGVHRGEPSPDPPGQTLVFGLPGNPVSAMVTFVLLVQPALARMSGAAGADPARLTATMDAEYAKRPGRLHAVRCRAELLEDGWHVRPTGAQGSHILTSMLGADALAMIEAERGDVAAGERVEIELLR